MAEVTLDGVTKRFGATTAVDGLDLTVRDGELLVLLGPTGAGKTTTLRLVSGLERSDSGRIAIGGTDVGAAPPAARDVAFVFQQYSLYPHYTVYDNLAFPLRSPMHRLPEPEIKRRIHEVAEMLRISDKLDNRATALSGGQMQRVAIGRALVRKPNCFLMDEPLSSLDAKLREDLRVELKRIQRDLGSTILYVTHDQVEALTLADRIGVMDEGGLLQVATPETIYQRPIDTRVARRLGSPGINLLPAAAVAGLAPSGAETVGLRPEAIRLHGAEEGGPGHPGRITQVAHAGAETVVLVETLGHQVHVLLKGVRDLAPGRDVLVDMQETAALAFDGRGRLMEV